MADLNPENESCRYQVYDCNSNYCAIYQAVKAISDDISTYLTWCVGRSEVSACQYNIMASYVVCCVALWHCTTFRQWYGGIIPNLKLLSKMTLNNLFLRQYDETGPLCSHHASLGMLLCFYEV